MYVCISVCMCVYLYVCVYIDLGELDHDLTVRPKTGNMLVYFLGKSFPKNRRKIQVNEIFSFTQIFGNVWL